MKIYRRQSGTLRKKWAAAALFVAVAGIAIVWPEAARAYEEVGPPVSSYPYFDDRLSINLGVLNTFINTQLQVNRNNLLPGTFFDFESDLGLEGSMVRFYGDANFRLGKHASLGLTYLDISRSSTKRLSKEIQFADRVYAVNTTLNAFVNTRFYLLNYKYSFVRNAYQEFGASFGFNVADISAGLGSSAGFSAPAGSTETVRGKEVSLLAPVPLLGIYFSSQVVPKVFIRNAIQYCDIDAGGYSFKSLVYTLGLDYLPWKNFGLGVGVYSNRLQVEKGAELDGRFIYAINGTQLYLKYFY